MIRARFARGRITQVNSHPAVRIRTDSTTSGLDMVSIEYMEDVLIRILEALVSDPEDLTVETEDHPERVEFRVIAPQRERAKIIGSGGRVIRGLKSVIGALGGKMGMDVEIRIIE